MARWHPAALRSSGSDPSACAASGQAAVGVETHEKTAANRNSRHIIADGLCGQKAGCRFAYKLKGKIKIEIEVEGGEY